MKKLLVRLVTGLFILVSGWMVFSYLGGSKVEKEARPVQDLKDFSDVISAEDAGEWDVPPLDGELTSDEESISSQDFDTD